MRFGIIQINVGVVIGIIDKFLETRNNDQEFIKDSLEKTSRGWRITCLTSLTINKN